MSKNKPSSRHVEDQLLLDFLEGEMDADLKEELEQALAESDQDARAYAALQATRKIVAGPRQQVPMPSDKRFDQLHDQLMHRIDHTKIESKVFRSIKNPRFVVSFLLLCLVCSSVLFLVQSFKPGVQYLTAKNSQEDKRDIFVTVSVEMPESVLDTLISDRGEGDLLFEAAAQRIGQMDGEEARSFFGKFEN